MDKFKYLQITGLGLMLILAIVSYHTWDLTIARYFYGTEQSIAQLLTKLGYSTKYFISLTLGWALSYWRGWILWAQRAKFMLFCLLSSAMICDFLKPLLSRARPIEYFNHDLYGFYPFMLKASFYSMPSGHTTTFMALCFGLAIVWPRFKLGFILLGFGLSLTRVIITAHYLSDVLIACVLAYLCCVLMDKHYKMTGCKI